MRCFNCGRNIPDASTRCPNCGSVLSGNQRMGANGGYQQRGVQGNMPQNRQMQQYPQQPYPQQPYPQQPYPQQPYPQQPYPQQNKGGVGFGVASMVCGILSILLFCIPYVGIPLAIVGLVLGAVGVYKHQGSGKGMAVAGVVTSIVSLGLLIILIIIGASTPGIIREMFS